MKPHPRIRKTVKWGGAVVTVLLVVVWIGSVFGGVVGVTNHGMVFILRWGRLDVVDYHTTVHWLQPSLTFAWLPAFKLQGGFHWRIISDIVNIRIPLWPVVCALLLLTALAFRLDTLATRRVRLGRCTKCNYDLTGLARASGTVCPECGAAT